MDKKEEKRRGERRGERRGGGGVQDIQLSYRGCRSWKAVGGRWKFESVFQSIVLVPNPC
jgi:hypothetical protein